MSSLRYDWLAALLGILGTMGAYQDLWAHTHVPQLETFFTPWHAVLYGAFLLYAGFLAGTALLNHAKGYAWLRSMPRGYEIALVGVFIFAVSGVGDLIWHQLFGIEKNIEALLSPTHLGLGLGGFLMKLAPLRAAWYRSREEELLGWRALGPALLSLVCLLTAFTFFSWFANPFVFPVAAIKASGSLTIDFSIQGLGVASILLQVALLMGPLLLVVRRWQLPFGALTLVFTLMGVAASVPMDTYYLLPVLLLGGLGADLLLRMLKPASDRVGALRTFAFLAPIVLYLLYFIELALVARVAWTIHMWMGSCLLAGVVSLLLSYMLFSPASLNGYRKQ
ncbi:hypothetical protein KDA_48270 [Dictyobacter alpinus]|uniref:Uncharacterized protein n=1 Tax=Dictyobacter alpinus TaxID=2014873 RepID=A0A402BD70_9CHLR|nr:hypothetical protein KDA_48270 [Dictyobacter alpinus]